MRLRRRREKRRDPRGDEHTEEVAGVVRLCWCPRDGVDWLVAVDVSKTEITGVERRQKASEDDERSKSERTEEKRHCSRVEGSVEFGDAITGEV